MEEINQFNRRKWYNKIGFIMVSSIIGIVIIGAIISISIAVIENPKSLPFLGIFLLSAIMFIGGLVLMDKD